MQSAGNDTPRWRPKVVPEYKFLANDLDEV